MFALRAISALTITAALLASVACRSAPIPRADHTHGDTPHQYLRTTDWVSESFWAYAAPDAYEGVTRLPRNLSDDQRLGIMEYGEPDYSREFKSLEGETVLEWLMIDEDALLQYIDGELVYQGEIRDLEHVLLRRGYPTHVVFNTQIPSEQRITFIYNKVFSAYAAYYSFVDGQLVHEDHHR